MAHNLPNFIALKSVYSGGYAAYMFESNDVRGLVRCGDDSPYVYNQYAKIAIEKSKNHDMYVHLRFTQSNKYWARRGPDTNDRWILASNNQPEEDISKSSCTLFEPTIDSNGLLQLTHVQSRGRVRTDTLPRLYVDTNSSSSQPWYKFNFVDLDTLVILPKNVVFKGDNGKYLQALWNQDREYLQFSSTDGNDKRAGFKVTMMPNGYIRIKSHHWKKFWRRSPNWIWADSMDTVGSNVDTLFWPVKVNDNTIALRNAGNNNFCKRLTTEGSVDCLNAAVSTITKEAKIQVEELVLERSIFDVRYRIEDARIFDEKPFIVGTGTATNDTNEAASLTIRVAYEDSTSNTFSNSVSIMAGVSTTIKAGIPFIAEGHIEFSVEVTTSLEWNRTKTETKTAEASYTTVVPPMSRAKVSYVATKGTCNIPFSYTQRDQSSTDGSFHPSQHIDGAFSGINYYSFNFEQPQVESL